MARPSLGNLLSVASDQGTELEPPAPQPAVVKDAPKSVEPIREAKATKPTRATGRAAAKKAQASQHWTEYERLEARLRDEQVAKLDVLTRQLNKRRDGVGDRITKNTLLRVAVDLLLDHEHDLDGTTEAEILRAAQRNKN